MSKDAKKLGNEFDLIAQYFAPLAEKEPGARGLKDDAAVLDLPAGQQMVATMDTVVSGVHFLPSDPPESIAAKIMGVNLSDLASMGASPYVYTLSAALTKDIDSDWLMRFSDALKQVQDKYGFNLVGGDTVVTPGPLTLSLNAMGLVPSGQSLSRMGANPGDLILVSGRVGDGALGLKVLQNALTIEDVKERQRLVNAYQCPEPQLELGKALRGLATSAIDISDGLVQDLGHICQASGVGATLELEKIPVSPAIGKNPDLMELALSGGDDYQLLFTVPGKKIHEINIIKEKTKVKCSVIGEITSQTGVCLLKDGVIQKGIPDAGYNHFKG